MSISYTLFAGSRQLPLHQCEYTHVPGRILPDGHRYDIASLEASGPVRLVVTSEERDLSHSRLLPESASARFSAVSAHRVEIDVERPGQYVLEPAGRHEEPLAIFVNPPETARPAPDAPGVRYFGPGEHRPGHIELHSGETLYLAEGAVVHATLYAEGDDITVCGRGILTQREFPRGTVRHSNDFRHCNRLCIQDVILADPCFWNLVLRDCHEVTVENVKVCGGRMLNDDAIDICNCTDVTVTGCFLRAQDDIIALKGEPDEMDLEHNPKLDSGNPADLVETGRANLRIRVEKCVMWCDKANVCRYGYECTASEMAYIILRDCDIIHISDEYRATSEFWRQCIFLLQADCGTHFHHMLFEELRIHTDGNDLIFLSAGAMECTQWKGFGTISDCVFRNISVTGTKGDFRGEIHLLGVGDAGKVGRITLDNITYYGKKLTPAFPFQLIEGTADAPDIR